MRAVLILAVLLAWVWCVVAVVGLTGYLVAIAAARQAAARQAVDEQAATSHRAGLKVAVVLVVGCVVLAGLVFGQYRLRQATSGGDGPVCIVTPKSLERAPQRYDGVDHPLDPRDGDQYRNPAGCLVGEVSCWRSIEIIGNRLYCST